MFPWSNLFILFMKLPKNRRHVLEKSESMSAAICLNIGRTPFIFCAFGSLVLVRTKMHVETQLSRLSRVCLSICLPLLLLQCSHMESVVKARREQRWSFVALAELSVPTPIVYLQLSTVYMQWMFRFLKLCWMGVLNLS